MTVPYPLGAFDNAQVLRRRRPLVERDKLVSIGITLAIHALILAGALTVVQVHLPFLFAAHMPFPHAYLAVDFFFMLSGFVLTYAYGDRLGRGWPTRLFLRERVFRLYPLYLLVLPLGFAYLLFTSRRNGTPLSHAQAALILLLGLLMLPLPQLLNSGTPYPFPANIPSWSLFYELVANLGHALFLRQRTRVQLAFLLVAAGLLLIPIAYTHSGLNLGAVKGEVLTGLVRAAFSYTFGMLLLDLWREGRLRRFGSALASTVLLLVVLLSPLAARANAIADLAAVFVVFPSVLILAANTQTSQRFAPLMSLLGTTSYALYVLHVPMYAIFSTLWGALLHSKTADHAPLSGVVYLLFLLAVCYVLDRFYDLPVRRYLRRYTRTPKSSL